MSDTDTATATRESAGRLPDGSHVEAVTLTNAGGVSARILTYGATLQSLIAPDAHGALTDVILGHDDVAGYVEARGFLGVTIGRYANRIAGGRFALGGHTYQVDRNEGANTLHGGNEGLDRLPWSIDSVSSGPVASVTLSLVSFDGHQGFPGEVAVSVTYSLSGCGELSIEFTATTTRSTILNITNHALFDLAGNGNSPAATTHRLTIPAAAYVPVDAQMIPTGELRLVEGTVFDFRAGRAIVDGVREGRDSQIAIGRGYDHTFALDKGQTDRPQLAARLEDPVSGRRLDVLTTEPGLQLYTGNMLQGTVIGKGGRIYRMGDGIALEPQKFPDTPNRPSFGSARVDPGETYRHIMIYRLSVIP